MISIIDYGMGNLASVEKALKKLNLSCLITNKHNEIKESNAIILPGVGSFEQGMKNLKSLNLIELLTEEVINKKKMFLGICLGMQLIMEIGNEPSKCKGLGWIKGDVIPIKNKKMIIPHLGWNNIYKNFKKAPSDEIMNNFYFIHSYHVIPKEDIDIQWVSYEFPMVASLKKDNIFATQFHPEKSQEAGLKLLKEYFITYA